MPITKDNYNKHQLLFLNMYNESVWDLAYCLNEGRKLYGYNKVQKYCPLSKSKVKWLLAVAEVPRVEGLSIDHHAEVINTKRKIYWLHRAKKENWNPLQLRAEIRRATATFSNVESKAANARQYPQLLDNIERELNRMSPEENGRAKQYIASKLSSLS